MQAKRVPKRTPKTVSFSQSAYEKWLGEEVRDIHILPPLTHPLTHTTRLLGTRIICSFSDNSIVLCEVKLNPLNQSNQPSSSNDTHFNYDLINKNAYCSYTLQKLTRILSGSSVICFSHITTQEQPPIHTIIRKNNNNNNNNNNTPSSEKNSPNKLHAEQYLKDSIWTIPILCTEGKIINLIVSGYRLKFDETSFKQIHQYRYVFKPHMITFSSGITTTNYNGGSSDIYNNRDAILAIGGEKSVISIWKINSHSEYSNYTTEKDSPLPQGNVNKTHPSRRDDTATTTSTTTTTSGFLELLGHTASVNAVAWVPNQDKSAILMSVSDDGNA